MIGILTNLETALALRAADDATCGFIFDAYTLHRQAIIVRSADQDQYIFPVDDLTLRNIDSFPPALQPLLASSISLSPWDTDVPFIDPPADLPLN